ncbi:MAG TPA: MFS transporter [Thermomicrobiales bacterium]|nr:MFS transporter [Thermomicrobiales bacterium]
MTRLTRGGAGRPVLLTTSAIHVANDACFALLYPLLPFIAADLNLSYTEVGLLKATFSGAASAFQIPAGIVGARYGEMLVLLLGNAWVGLGLLAMAATGTFALLLAAAILAGIGGNAQHPLAASIVSKSVPRSQMAMALGTLNFAGDLGKLIGPFIAGLIAVQFGWRYALGVVGLFTAIFSISLLLRRRTPRVAQEAAATPVPPAAELPGAERIERGFRNVMLAGGLDSATRGAALTFLPFILAEHGFNAAAISALFGVIFAAGAAGKFVCGWLTGRWGILAVIVATEMVTAGSLLAIIVVPGWATVPLVIVFGFALNGTSSALSAGVSHFVPASLRARGYGTYFTAALVSSAIAPLAYGALGDAAGLAVVFVTMAAMTVAVIPAVLPARARLAESG